jgi:arginase family enzyme
MIEEISVLLILTNSFPSTLSGILRHRPETGIIWVDAHADINTIETSPTGNIHGM